MPAESSRMSDGRSYSSQWTHVPRGASGSSATRAKHFVRSAGSFHFSGMEMSAQSHVCSFGIASFREYAELINSNAMPHLLSGDLRRNLSGMPGLLNHTSDQRHGRQR